MPANVHLDGGAVDIDYHVLLQYYAFRNVLTGFFFSGRRKVADSVWEEATDCIDVSWLMISGVLFLARIRICPDRAG